jgi:glycolate oxidase FAD binding subunit
LVPDNDQFKTSFKRFAEIVGADHVRRAAPADAIDGRLPKLVVEPGSNEELARALAAAAAAGLGVAPRGGGSKMDWGSLPRRVDLVLSTRRLNRVLEHAWADMTATVQAGCTVEELQRTLAGRRQRLALDPLWPARATVGGILATNDSGALRLRYGALRDLVIGITVALPAGEIVKSGGKVVKNVAGYDLHKLMIGALGTLGVIVEAVFRLYPAPRAEQTVSLAVEPAAALNRIAQQIKALPAEVTGLQIRAGSGAQTIVDVRFEGESRSAQDSVRSLPGAQAGRVPAREPGDVWQARERLWQGAETSLVCKLSILPAQLDELLELLNQVAAAHRVEWKIVAQATGLCTLRLEHRDAPALRAALDHLRDALSGAGGSVSVLRCPPQIKAQIDVWAEAGAALSLMRRVKERFDPNWILNPGRFVGGI